MVQSSCLLLVCFFFSLSHLSFIAYELINYPGCGKRFLLLSFHTFFSLLFTHSLTCLCQPYSSGKFFYHIYLFLLGKHPNPATVGLIHINAKESKGIEAQRVKPTTPSWVIKALIGDEEPNGKQKRTKRKKQGAGLQPSYLDHVQG